LISSILDISRGAENDSNLSILNVSDKWCLISLLVSVFKVAQPDVNAAFAPPPATAGAETVVARVLRELRRSQLKAVFLGKINTYIKLFYYVESISDDYFIYLFSGSDCHRCSLGTFSDRAV
jgi:hypothetical protein